MLKLTMFDIDNEKIRERKLNFIEILLIVGGIIGGIRLKQDEPMNQLLGYFLICSILYYLLVSEFKENILNNKEFFNPVFLFLAFFIAACFSAIAILPLIIPGITVLYGNIIYLLYIILTTFISLVLYGGRREKIEEQKEKA